MIRRVYEQSIKAQCFEKVIVATDHAAIFAHVKDFGGDVEMTSERHQSGTDRCAQVLANNVGKFDYAINIQGDEPFIDPQQIDLIASILDGQTEIATLGISLNDEESLFSPNTVKVIFDKNRHAIYFSRHPIPFIRNYSKDQWLNNKVFYKHIGLYAYRTDILSRITKLTQSSLELAESLEQLRWIENGFKIKVAITDIDSIGIDTPEDLQRAIEKML